MSTKQQARAADVGGVSGAHLKTFVERIERLSEELAALKEDIKDIFAECKGSGFDTRIVRKVVALRRRQREEIDEEQMLTDLYMRALGELPLFERDDEPEDVPPRADDPFLTVDQLAALDKRETMSVVTKEAMRGSLLAKALMVAGGRGPEFVIAATEMLTEKAKEEPTKSALSNPVALGERFTETIARDIAGATIEIVTDSGKTVTWTDYLGNTWHKTPIIPEADIRAAWQRGFDAFDPASTQPFVDDEPTSESLGSVVLLKAWRTGHGAGMDAHKRKPAQAKLAAE